MTGKIPTYTQDDELIMVYPCEAPLESLHRPESDIRKVKAQDIEAISCTCCESSGAHSLGHANAPNIREYDCGTCRGYGYFALCYGDGDYLEAQP